MWFVIETRYELYRETLKRLKGKGNVEIFKVRCKNGVKINKLD